MTKILRGFRTQTAHRFEYVKVIWHNLILFLFPLSHRCDYNHPFNNVTQCSQVLFPVLMVWIVACSLLLILPKYHYHNITTTFTDEVEFARFRFKSGGSHANCSQSLESVNIAFLNSLSFTVDQDSVKVDMYSCFGQNRGIKEDEDFEVNF